MYLSYTKKYPEPLLREVLGQVMEIPTERIKKSRGAFFNYLIRKMVKDTREFQDTKFQQPADFEEHYTK